MSLEDKVERLKKVTGLFDQLMDEIAEVRTNVDLRCRYSEGYAACLSDILKDLIEEKDSEVMKAIRVKVEMDSRKEVLDELTEGLSNLQAAYKKILDED